MLEPWFPSLVRWRNNILHYCKLVPVIFANTCELTRVQLQLLTSHPSYSCHTPAKFDSKISTCESPVNHWWITTRVNYYWVLHRTLTKCRGNKTMTKRIGSGQDKKNSTVPQQQVFPRQLLADIHIRKEEEKAFNIIKKRLEERTYYNPGTECLLE